MSAPVSEEIVRRLATVRRVVSLSPIAGANTVELARVDGWEVVVTKGEFQPGDLCVYFELDSILPKANPYFAFLEGRRLKQRKICGVYSQGLALPLAILPNGAAEGSDLTEELGVTRWECPLEIESGDGKLRRLPPGLIKTGEDRVQNCSAVLRSFAENGTEVVITDKIDGTSTSYWYDGISKFLVCGHNTVREPSKDDAHYFKMAERYQIEQIMRRVGLPIAIQGEIASDKICGNTLGLAKGEMDFLVFYIRDLKTGRKWPYDKMIEFCREWGLTPVPERYRGPFPAKWGDLATLKIWVNSLDYKPKYPQEGVVVASEHHSFKVISERWLERWGR